MLSVLLPFSFWLFKVINNQLGSLRQQIKNFKLKTHEGIREKPRGFLATAAWYPTAPRTAPSSRHLLLTRLGFRGSLFVVGFSFVWLVWFVCRWVQKPKPSSNSHCSFPVLQILIFFLNVTRAPGLLKLNLPF